MVDNYLLFCSTIFIASIVPGPSMLLALSHGMKYGARRTTASACGNVVASVIQATVSVAGLAAVLSMSEILFLCIKWLGIVYLVYIGIVTWCSAGQTVNEEAAASDREKSPLKMFSQAFLVAAGNPKAIVFFTALFPQFINTELMMASQYAVIMGTLSIIAFACFMAYALGGQRVILVLKKASITRILNRIMGGTFISAGIGMAVTD